MKRSILQSASDFPIFNGNEPYIYLDNAATTQKPQLVLDSLIDYYSHCNANVYRAIHRWGEESTRRYEDARQTVASFIGAASRDEIIFTSGCTDSINLAATVFCRRFIKPGDEIILTEMEHHSNLVPWQIQGDIGGAVLKFIPVKEDGELDLEVLETLWTPRTKLLALTHMSNVLGTVNPAKKIIAMAHERGVKVLVDAAQSVPHMKVDVGELDCDFLAFSGHKMCGPTGTGVLYGKKELLEDLPPYRGGGEMIRSVYLDHSEWNSLPYKFEAGTPHIAGAIGLAAAIRYLESWGMEKIEEQEKVLTKRLIEGLDSLKEYTLFGRARERGGIAAFTRKGTHSHDLTQYLDSQGFALRAGHHCAHPLARKLNALSTTRASVYFYNTLEEIDSLLETLAIAGDFVL
ncbi:aminotransferase class V-fold PLP-dependent enzyme [Oceanispirochaeta sp.]|uniref:aminotransferase class V-fold PLP-dependent enzyme n=1 Tax=Oceanispirochaeta sp. TaxID=2035350 RepID=UPI00260D0F80|nr:cysteine desulfurase [Oceanispirochaeta sp.]MDA3958050.1 cysteine desulfurase [Oceanispirochaeta sp.]